MRNGQPAVGEPSRASPGPVVFARFGYPPNALGYCGPADPAGFLGAAAEGTDLATVSALAARFDGAWPYLQLIAACNGISDPLDARVVDAYWIGNPLLEQVPALALVAHLDERFERRAGRGFFSVAEAALLGGAAHHSFHVFAVYPWLGLLRAGMDRAPLVVLDQCRVRWGTVLAVEGDLAVVSSRALVLDGHVLAEGPERVEQVRASVDGVGFGQDLVAGDRVALHWDWVCERLSPNALARLTTWTRRTLQAVNALPAPGPAVACDTRGG
jgi:hypothetical protein